VHYGHPGNVRSVLVDGEFLMRDGVVLSMDEAEVLATAEVAAEAAWRRLHERDPDIPLPPRLEAGR
jgi:5-methylthioadenosine/S-adenosylhomocysteine deaminase